MDDHHVHHIQDTIRDRLPDTAIISITERCNSKCDFCKIWEIADPGDLDVSLIDKLPSSLKNIDLTGGEPLLHKDLELIVEKFTARNCHINVITNGLVNLRKFENLWHLTNLGIRFSLDGIEEVHDSIRGIEGNYKKVIEQIEYLKLRNFNDIGLSSTFADINIDQMTKLYSLSKELEVQFGIMVVGKSENYYQTCDNEINAPDQFRTSIRQIIKKELGTFNIRKWGRVIYMNELIRYVQGKFTTLHCPAASKFFFMKPSGEIFTCNIRDTLLGNLSETSFEDLWFSQGAKKERKIVQHCPTPCWTMCNAKSIILDHLPKYFFRFSWNLPSNLLRK